MLERIYRVVGRSVAARRRPHTVSGNVQHAGGDVAGHRDVVPQCALARRRERVVDQRAHRDPLDLCGPGAKNSRSRRTTVPARFTSATILSIVWAMTWSLAPP